jgi:hypothetical protein
VLGASACHPRISIVTPVYACAGCLEQLYKRLIAALSKITDDFENLMVNDAMLDGHHRPRGSAVARD